MISDKTVELLTQLRGLCEEVVDDRDHAHRPENWQAVSGMVDTITDIMAGLMAANSIEQRALLAQKCGVSCGGDGGDVGDAVRRVFANMDERGDG